MVNLKRLKSRRREEKIAGGNSFQELVVLSKKYSDEKNYAQEERCYRNMLRIKPNNSDVLNHLGTVLCKRGEFTESIECLRKALKINPDDFATYINLGDTLSRVGLVQEAIHCVRTFLSSPRQPDHGQPGMEAHRFELHSGHLFNMNYLAGVDQSVIFAETEKMWQDFTPPAEKIYTHAARPLRRDSGKIRLGLVSGDFRLHSVAYFLLPLLERLNKDIFEVYCYSNVFEPDDLTAHFRALANWWRPIASLSTEEAAALIFRDEIDILIDLAGFTGRNRLAVFAMRPAPIQVSYLGYANTTGLKSIDYRLTDAICDPPGEADQYHTETLIRLPHSFLCYAPSAFLPEPRKVTSSVRCVFGSFNNISKLTEEVIGVWAEILRRLPQASILLKEKAFIDKATRKRVISLFGGHGVPPHRVRLEPRTPALLEHLAMYNQVDIALDPFPYNGTTTTFEALAMNVPVITLRGERHASRVGASILTNMGLPELIGGSTEEYISIAVRLASDKEKTVSQYKGLRQTLCGSVLCDAAQFTRQMEEVFLEMVKKYTTTHHPCSPS